MIIIPGAQKSGTSTIFEVLCQHSAVRRPKLKEPQFFALTERTVERWFPWYAQEYLSQPHTISIDASTFYLPSPQTPELLFRYVPNSKIIIILRDPAKRAYSSYLHMHKKYPCADRRKFTQIVSAIEKKISLKGLNEAETATLHDAAKRKEIIDDYLQRSYSRNEYIVSSAAEFQDCFIAYRYFDQSIYSTKVEQYQRFFAGNVKVVFFEQLLRRPETVINEVLAFCDLPRVKDIGLLPQVNKTRVPRNNIVRYILAAIYRFRCSSILPEKTREKFRWTINKLLLFEPKLDKEMYRCTRKLLSAEYIYWISRYPQIADLWSE
jgi:hypothetical protein